MKKKIEDQRSTSKEITGTFFRIWSQQGKVVFSENVYGYQQKTIDKGDNTSGGVNVLEDNWIVALTAIRVG